MACGFCSSSAEGTNCWDSHPSACVCKAYLAWYTLHAQGEIKILIKMQRSGRWFAAGHIIWVFHRVNKQARISHREEGSARVRRSDRKKEFPLLAGVTEDEQMGFKWCSLLSLASGVAADKLVYTHNATDWQCIGSEVKQKLWPLGWPR